MKKINQTIIELVIEKADDGELWGRVQYEDNLIIETASTQKEIEEKILMLLREFHNVNVESISFEISYDMVSFFEQFDFLKISKIAEIAGINPSLMRQYASGSKYAAKKQVERINKAIQTLGNRLARVNLIHSNH